MGRLIDLTGKRFGQLTVLRRDADNVLPSGLHEPMWLCRCDCGKETSVRGAFLRSGHTTSCGCGQTGHNFIDLTGRHFGSVTVLSRIENTMPIEWHCRCDCGNEFDARGSSLVNGHTKSCGCRKKQLRIKGMVGRRFGKLTVVSRGPDELTKDGRRHIRWICKCDCGRMALMRGTSLRSGHTISCGCARVKGIEQAPTSYGEVWISEYLSEHGYRYTSQKCYPSLVSANDRPLFFDFEVKLDGGRSILIECQGIQHYRPVEWFGGEAQFLAQQDNDKRKCEYVRRHKRLLLIELPYVSRMDKKVFLQSLCQSLERYSMVDKNTGDRLG